MDQQGSSIVYLGGCQLSFGREQLGSRGIIFMGDTFARVPHVKIYLAGYAISKLGPHYMGDRLFRDRRPNVRRPQCPVPYNFSINPGPLKLLFLINPASTESMTFYQSRFHFCYDFSSLPFTLNL